MPPLRIGYVRYLNTRPLVEGLDALAGVELVPAVPAQLASLLLDGSIDVALASLIDAARADGRLTLLPAGIIGCDGPTLTVRLFSRVPFERITRLHADAESHTSVVLCRVILARRFEARPAVVEFDASHALPSGNDADPPGPEALLLIGDKVVTRAPDPRTYPFQLDLGEAWHDLTSLPFVYAAWMCRSDRADDPAVRVAADLLDRQRRRNLARLAWIAARRAPEHNWPVPLAREYLSARLRYDLGERQRAGADAFLRAAADLALAPSCTLRWLTPSAPTATAPPGPRDTPALAATGA